ncbi:MAG: anthranilate synthase component I family protein [Sphingobacteriaceae bacterium]
MNKIKLETICTHHLADVYTPVGIYLRLRDRFRDTILLESTDFHAAENSYSFIGVNAIAGIEVTNYTELEFKLPAQESEKRAISAGSKVPNLLQEFIQCFEYPEVQSKEARFAQSVYGYTSFDALPFFENIDTQASTLSIPLMRYRLYQYVIVINHFKDELIICENKIAGLPSELEVVESLIKSKDVPVYPFKAINEERSNLDEATYRDMVSKGIKSCLRGDVFQIVLSRRFEQSFIGDEFNVYRALRNINPSPYLFFFDYGDYKLMGSSPESQLIIHKGKATVHPIAGTIQRSGDEAEERRLAAQLQADAKEQAEHVMLVDLARNDLSRVCDEVAVTQFREVHYYSHVIHLVSEVQGTIRPNTNTFEVLAKTFPAGTLSGAPKYKALQIIKQLEPTDRGYYGGCIGVIGLNGDCNQAIMIRTFLSKNHTLYYQAGAGVVAGSKPENELQEVNHKLNALKKAIIQAGKIS